MTTSASGAPAWLTRPDYLVAIVTTALIVLLHACFTPNVGGLWRDEVNTINLATLSTWGDLWRSFNQDSFPLLFASIARIWSGVFGSGDDSLRILGLLIGLGVVAAIWTNARLLGLKFPFWTLILVGANPLIIRYGDSIRAYGLGVLLLLLMFGLVWRLSQTPTRRWFLLATVVSVLAVHAVYYNAVLLFALCAGGCSSALLDKRWRAAAAVFFVGLIAALSMVPYLPAFLNANDWNFLVQYPFTLPFMWQRISQLLGAPFSIGIFIWPALVLTALVIAGIKLSRREPSDRRALIIFCMVSLLTGLVAYTCFLQLLNYYTQVWYYIALATFVAACLDPLLYPISHRTLIWLRTGAVAFFLITSSLTSSRLIAQRHTNIDLTLEALHSLAAPEDLVLLTRWECGVTMHRYYKGKAPWTTIPPLPDFRFQAYQPILAHMRAEAPLQPILENVESTLRSGHKVWVVGPLAFPAPGESIPALRRVTGDDPTYQGSPQFYQVWVMQVSELLKAHSISFGKVPLPEENKAPFEELPLGVIQGWKE